MNHDGEHALTDARALLDLSPERLAATLLDAGLERQHALKLRADAAPLLAPLDPATRLLGEHLIEDIARLAAGLDALAQQHRQAALSREERLRIDPLRHIPQDRQRAAALPLRADAGDAVAIEAGDPAFAGHGWFTPDRTEGGSLRWSGMARCATLALPALGGGALRVSLALRSPFGITLDPAGQDWFLDGVPLAFETVSNDGTTGIFESRVTLPEMPAGSRLTLLLHGAQHTDPASGPRRDTRVLGLGLAWARIERA